MTKTKGLLFTAGFVLAMAFTFSCSGDDGDIDGGGSSPSGGGGSSPSGGGGSSPSGGDGSSPSGGGNSSSSGGDIDGGNSCPTASDYFTDLRDYETYKFEVAPDGTVWMSENLNFSIGDTIWGENWYQLDNTLGYCYGVDIDGAEPHRDASGCNNGYGRVYEWAVAIDGNPPQGLCPDGWHIPSTEEWNSVVAGYGERIMSPGFYIYPGNYNTNSEYPPLGWKDRDENGYYWTSSGNTYFTGFWERRVSSDFVNLEIQSGASSEDRFSVRCIADYKCPAPERSSSSVGGSSSSSVGGSSSSSGGGEPMRSGSSSALRRI